MSPFWLPAFAVEVQQVMLLRSDECLANALSMVAVTQGRSVVFDEQAGADTLNMP